MSTDTTNSCDTTGDVEAKCVSCVPLVGAWDDAAEARNQAHAWQTRHEALVVEMAQLRREHVEAQQTIERMRRSVRAARSTLDGADKHVRNDAAVKQAGVLLDGAAKVSAAH